MILKCFFGHNLFVFEFRVRSSQLQLSAWLFHAFCHFLWDRLVSCTTHRHALQPVLDTSILRSRNLQSLIYFNLILSQETTSSSLILPLVAFKCHWVLNMLIKRCRMFRSYLIHLYRNYLSLGKDTDLGNCINMVRNLHNRAITSFNLIL